MGLSGDSIATPENLKHFSGPGNGHVHDAHIIFDKFHLIANYHAVIDQVRRESGQDREARVSVTRGFGSWPQFAQEQRPYPRPWHRPPDCHRNLWYQAALKSQSEAFGACGPVRRWRKPRRGGATGLRSGDGIDFARQTRDRGAPPAAGGARGESRHT